MVNSDLTVVCENILTAPAQHLKRNLPSDILSTITVPLRRYHRYRIRLLTLIHSNSNKSYSAGLRPFDLYWINPDRIKHKTTSDTIRL